MKLSSDLISQLVEATNDKNEAKAGETTVYGTVVDYDGSTFVQLDGSSELTPISPTVRVDSGDRVTVLIKNHTAIVTGNISSPSPNSGDLQNIKDTIAEFGTLIGEKVNVKDLDAEKARIDALVAYDLVVKDTLAASSADISDLKADNAEIKDTLKANNADISSLKTDKLDATVAEATFAKIKELEATTLQVNNLEAAYGAFKQTTTVSLTAINASIEDLQANKLSAKDIEGKYANIDFSNIGEAAMERFYANSGLIKDVVIGDATISGRLVGVTISGELIEGGTIVAEKLVIKGEDGLYYKLNTNGVTTEAEQTDYNSLNGQVIRAHSVTAEKISVSDLVAFDATIGGFKITENSIYSGVKESIDNSTRGIYLDNDGQVAFGDASNFIKYYKDANGNYKLDISADSISIGSSGTSVETLARDAQTAIDAVNDIKNKVESGDLDGEDATVLRIDSSRGTVFKNNAVSTVLSVVIYRGSKRITDITALREEYGASAYIQWLWQRIGEDTFGTILSTDSRIGNDGFTFTLSPADVDTKVVFMCQLITD